MLFFIISCPQVTEWYLPEVFVCGSMIGKGWHLFFGSEAPGLVFSEEKDSGLPPVTSEKAPALSFLELRVGDQLMSSCKHL
jgi:hypothetical protein